MWLTLIFFNTEVSNLYRTVCVGRPRSVRKIRFLLEHKVCLPNVHKIYISNRVSPVTMVDS